MPDNAFPHESAHLHVTGEALYVDDIPVPESLLHACCGLSDQAHATIAAIDLGPVRDAPGVVAVLAAADIPGINDASPIAGDDPVFADGVVEYAGQSLFAVYAETRAEARRAARLARVEYAPMDPVLDIASALAQGADLLPAKSFSRGDADGALEGAPHRLSGRIEIGGQEHFYLESHIALALPQEDGDMAVHSSSQHPSEIQHVVAKVLAKRAHNVTVEVRRMGGAFGGKESQASLFAAIAALGAAATGRPVKFRPDRDDDMVMTGKRHDFVIDYDVGFDARGRIQGISIDQAARCGRSVDLSASICDRAMFHADNCYFLEDVEIRSRRLKTHTVSNTAFRGFGGPQGMVGMERAIDAIAFHLGLDPLDVRQANLYGGPGRDVTPYHMKVEDNAAPRIIDELEATSDYRARKEAMRAFNGKSRVLKRGLALTPVKFGISFTAAHLNQAGALVHVYADGTVHVNHGGTEMGQGLHVKISQVVAAEFGLDLADVRATATRTDKVPNSSPTAASSGADMNGMAAQAAARKIRARLTAFAATHFAVGEQEIFFAPGRVRIGGNDIAFKELVNLAYMGRISLSATGFYATPKVHFDQDSGRGRPFFYFAYGAAVSEAEIDILTGENRITRVDILHDVGRSLNPAIDLGQIEGGYIQGMGWLTTEELVWNGAGQLMTHAPSTYKIPACADRPPDMRIALLEGNDNVEDTIHRSKAVGEPPLMLAISAFAAIVDAVASVGNYKYLPGLDAPATPERVLGAVMDMASRSKEP